MFSQLEFNAMHVAGKSLAAVCVMAVSLAALPSISAARQMFPANGGTGDARAQDECQRGWYIIGFSGRVGAWIDQISITCARFNADNSIAEQRARPARGGNGGGPMDINCPRGSVVGGVRYEMTGGNKQVVAVIAQCRPLAGGNTSTISFSNPDDRPARSKFFLAVEDAPAALSPEVCAPDDAATGMQINYGQHVNAAGLICDQLIRAAAPLPPPVATNAGSVQGPVITGKAGPITPARLAQWVGRWNTQTDAGGRYEVIFKTAGDQLVGAFRDLNGNSQYDGTLTGKPLSTGLLYTYTQPKSKSTGKGIFILNAAGNGIAGNGFVEDAAKTKFRWWGTKAGSSAAR